MECIYCGHYITYKLKNNHLKCAKCKRKFSLNKIIRKEKILKAFLEEIPPLKAAQKLNISYATIVKEYQNIRKVIANICEEEFLKKEEIKEFDEYLYIPLSLKEDKTSIYKAHNFLTIDYGNRVYNIMLSSLKAYEDASPEEIEKMLRQSHIIKIKQNLTIPKFWRYFEEFIKKFKGVNEENFFFYLKEAEFRFNKFQITLKDIL